MNIIETTVLQGPWYTEENANQNYSANKVAFCSVVRFLLPQNKSF